MAKKRRAQPGKAKPTRKAPLKKKKPAPAPRRAVKAHPATPAPADAPSPRQQVHLDAVVEYEQGVRALQRRDYVVAAGIFRSVLDGFPEEKELHERVRLYLNVCERATAPVDSTPQNADERVYAATLAMNTGAYREAVAHLQAAVRERPGHDHAHYMLGVAFAALRNTSDALAHLQKAIDLNPDNRSQAAQDVELDLLRDQSRFRTLVGAARRTPSR